MRNVGAVAPRARAVAVTRLGAPARVMVLRWAAAVAIHARTQLVELAQAGCA